MEEHKRTEAFEKDIHEEKHLSEFNHLIAGIDKSIIEDLDGKASPILFILGSQRSGSTLLSQMLINHFELGYPNNFIARFWKAPLIGTILYNQIFTSKPRLDYTSTLGYTDGPHGPHEFGYFWKSYFGEENNTSVDKSQLASILGGLTKQTQSPWLFKNLHYIKNNITEISRVYPESFFIHIQRDLVDCAVSTYKSRVQLFGSEEAWFGPKPSNYEKIKNESIERQILLQIHHINKDISLQLSKLPAGHYLIIESEKLVSHEVETLRMIHKQFPFLQPKEQELSDNPLLFPTRITQKDALYERIKEAAVELNLYTKI